MHDLRALLIAGLIGGAAFSAAAQASSVAGASSDEVPSDEQLEAAGARIGEIRIETKQIFNLDDPKENNWLFRTVDRLHVPTHPSTIRAQLVFHSGDLYSRGRLDESARNMRQNSNFLREPEIRPVRYHDGRHPGRRTRRLDRAAIREFRAQRRQEHRVRGSDRR
jgi:hypothetical protein